MAATDVSTPDRMDIIFRDCGILWPFASLRHSDTALKRIRSGCDFHSLKDEEPCTVWLEQVLDWKMHAAL